MDVLNSVVDTEDIKTRIVHSLDPEELVDRLNISIEDLVEILSDMINDQREQFYDLEDK